jgi:hypothetical protein
VSLINGNVLDEDHRNKYGLVALRQESPSRTAHEAWDQGFSLTLEDLALKLLNEAPHSNAVSITIKINCSIRIVRRDLKKLAK